MAEQRTVRAGVGPHEMIGTMATSTHLDQVAQTSVWAAEIIFPI